MPLRGQLKLLELEKKQAEREKAGAEFQLKEATQMNTQLNNNAVELNKRIALLESQLSSSNAKLNQIINSQGTNGSKQLAHVIRANGKRPSRKGTRN